MHYTVEGTDIPDEELNDDSWQPPPGLRAQEKRRSEIHESFPPLGQPPQHERASRSRSRTRNRSRSRSKSRSTSHHFVSSSSQGPSTSVAFPPGLAQGSSQCSSSPTKVAWGKGLPCSLKSSSQDPSPDTQVRELVRENASLKAQLSSQQSQISTLISQMGKLTQYIQSLESKLGNSLPQPALTTVSQQQQQQQQQPPPAPLPPPAAATAGKRKATTSTASLQIDADITAAITKAVADAFQVSDAKLEARFNAMDAKFETRLNTMQQAIDARFTNLEQAIANTHASHNALKQHTENAFASVNQRIGLALPSAHSCPSTQKGATPGN
ncbi:hypothetical protein HPB50_000935 [Hyalomma asiaticum]|uniref:Uncharacterized protein n=1 Tax=Hyalomma asiaticum TaxID=266040 RepID=A0ACB7RSB1_HYAAI|nr:hypothetical protein HPB50_000935 [Hyalomma asiaticum]